MRFVSPVLKRAVEPTRSGIDYLQRYSEQERLSLVTHRGVQPADHKMEDLPLDGSWGSSA